VVTFLFAGFAKDEVKLGLLAVSFAIFGANSTVLVVFLWRVAYARFNMFDR
jgi:hypothetical protein